VHDKDYLIIIGKGNKERTIPINTRLKQIIEEYLRWKKQHRESLHPNAPLFINRFRNRLSVRGIQYLMDEYIKKAGLERHLSPHAFRHSVGYRLSKRGVGIRIIQKLLGHSDIRTTAIYVEPDLDQVAQALVLL
jgi:site-specific recombinase XerD